METKERRIKILEDLKHSEGALSASKLAERYYVSRQVIVGDVAILKAQNEPIVATARGYIYMKSSAIQYQVVCKHAIEDMYDELEIMIDLGAKVIDVSIEHPIYGELIGQLNISSRYDIESFKAKVNQTKAKTLSLLSDGVHLHTIECDEQTYQRVIHALREKHYLYE